MKKTIKIAIGAFVLGAIIFGSIGVVASTVFAGSITYQPKNSAWKVSNVEDAIDDLYLKKVGDNYSTDEREIGTWIDGKPLYQKTISTTFATGNITTIPSDWIPQQFEVSMKSTASGLQSSTFYASSNNWWTVYLDNGYIMGIQGSTNYVGRDLFVTIRYTKVDPEPSNN